MEESFGTIEWIIIGLGFALGVIGFVGPRYHRGIWRNEVGMHPDLPLENWIFGVATWRGMIRIGSISAPFFVLAPVAVAAEQLLGPLHPLTVVSVVPTATLLVLFWSIFLFNRPRRFVAPQFRHQPGWIIEVFGARVEPTPPPSRLKQWRGRTLDRS